MDTTKRRALGKGLEELFNNEQLDFNKIEEKIIDSTPKEEIVELNLDELRSNPYQPRKVFDEDKLNELFSESETVKELISEYGAKLGLTSLTVKTKSLTARKSFSR